MLEKEISMTISNINNHTNLPDLMKTIHIKKLGMK